jgi:hypothetical protein
MQTFFLKTGKDLLRRNSALATYGIHTKLGPMESMLSPGSLRRVRTQATNSDVDFFLRKLAAPP